ncbi:glutaredoxin family protein [Micrococcus luteus]|uniref:glutaredoxin family protein n=1 Tax=Micrococcus luteus TaxID=1270 RepID=UPI002303B51E|nr:glutaredoxin family protein [Micrococcus luteus]
MSYTIYSQPGCGPCSFLTAALKRRGIEHAVINIRENPEAAERVIQLGGTGTPFTVNEATGQTWQGVDLDRYTVTVPEQAEPAPAAGPSQFTLGAEADGTPIHWSPAQDGALLVLTDADTTALTLQLIEEAAQQQWHVRVLTAAGSPLISTADRPRVHVAAADATQLALLEEIRELIETRYAHAQAAPLGSEPARYEPTMVLVDELETLRHHWAQTPGGERSAVDASLTLETLAEYGPILGIHLCVAMAHRASAFTAQDHHLVTLTPLAAGLPNEWAAESTRDHDGAGHAVLRERDGTQHLLRLNADTPARSLTHA